MNFRTLLQTTPSSFSISHQDSILLLGSCFTENIGKKLNDAKFNALINPLGIAFNPVSLHKLICLSPSDTSEINPSEKQGIFFHTDFHSKFNTTKADDYLDQIEKQVKSQEDQLKETHTVIITYGTAWVYESISENKIVNNCHKQAANSFTKRILTVTEIVTSWRQIQMFLTKKYKREFNFVFTVSPVRHLKDGFHENQVSKSTLLLAVNEICTQKANCNYFPAYEIMMDDLRDYRFYESDFIHPNQQGIDYIWENFQNCYFNKNTCKLNQRLEKIQRAIAHKAFNEDSTAHQKFLTHLLLEIKSLQAESGINFKQEIIQLEKQIN